MRNLLHKLFVGFILCTAVACGGNTDTAEEGKVPVSASDPKAPTTAPEEPTTKIGADLEDSLQEREQSRDSL
ncbi:hypothetical protein [Pontibacter mangrovi]|uniref:Secreted protein n=1 Tax=Pontibacter mangrovi TaxID=2589816 RepID=A0A501W441_9BACT|nr:hypothetical protein [Pontibacter mangrovi]TPE42894.1 hypothetical protein FJM65_16345 [Pontibacter mangrovi]